jgi:hypothetical protein
MLGKNAQQQILCMAERLTSEFGKHFPSPNQPAITRVKFSSFTQRLWGFSLPCLAPRPGLEKAGKTT